MTDLSTDSKGDIDMFGLGGIFNRIGYHRNDEPEWFADWVDEWMEDHMEETGCSGGAVDAFNDDDYLYCSWCGNPL